MFHLLQPWAMTRKPTQPEEMHDGSLTLELFILQPGDREKTKKLMTVFNEKTVDNLSITKQLNLSLH